MNTHLLKKPLSRGEHKVLARQVHTKPAVTRGRRSRRRPFARQTKRFGVLAVVLTLFALVAAPAAAATSAITLGLATLTGATIITPGTVSESSTPDLHKVRDVQDELYVAEPYKGGLWIFMQRLAQGRKPQNEKFEWEEDEQIPTNVSVTADQAAGAAGAAVSWSNAFDRYDIVTVEDHLYHPSSGQIVRVTTRTDTSIDVVRIDGGTDTTWGTVAALTTGEGLVNIGKVREEGHTVVPGVATMPVQRYNYIEETSDEIEITARRQNTRNYTVDDWTRTYDRKMYEFMVKQNFRLWTGKRYLKKIGGKRWTYSAGILDTSAFPLSRSVDFTIATFGKKDIVELFRIIKTDNGGSMRRVWFMDSKMQALLNDLDSDKVRYENYVSKVLEVGIYELVDTSSGHRILLVHEPAFDELAKVDSSFEYYGVVLDMALVKNHPFIPFHVSTTNNFAVNGKTTTVKRWHQANTLCLKGDKEHIITTAS